MYRYGLVTLFFAAFSSPVILALDLPYKKFEGLAVDQALHYFEPEGDDCSDSNETSDDEAYGNLQDACAENAHYFEFCAYDDEVNTKKSDRREKHARDMRKDRPYRVEYIASVRNLARLTKQVKRSFYNEARKNYLMDKLSIQKAAKLALEPGSSRRQDKIKCAFLRILVERQKETQKIIRGVSSY